MKAVCIKSYYDKCLHRSMTPGDELEVIRGGGLGIQGKPERYFAGTPQDYYDPVGGALTQLQHKEVGLLRDNLIGSGR